MKKTLTIASALLLVSGCASQTNYTTKVENADTTVVSGDNLNISNQDLYEYMMDQYGTNLVLNKALQSIAANYEVDEEALKTQLENTVNTYKSFMGEDLDTYAKENLGYDSFEAYQNEVIAPSLRQKMMIEDYSDHNFETLAKQYNFKKLRIIVVEDESTAISLISKLNSNEITFENAVTEYSTHSATKSNNGELGVVSDLSSTSSVDSAIISILPQLTVNALYSVPVQVSGGYAVVDVMETDIEAMKDDILSVLKSADEVTEEAEAYYLNENGFKVYEERLKENLQALNPDYVK